MAAVPDLKVLHLKKMTYKELGKYEIEDQIEPPMNWANMPISTKIILVFGVGVLEAICRL